MDKYRRHLESSNLQGLAASSFSLSIFFSNFRARILANSSRREAWSVGRFYETALVSGVVLEERSRKTHPNGLLIWWEDFVFVLGFNKVQNNGAYRRQTQAYRGYVPMVPIGVTIVDHHGDREKHIDTKFKDLEIGTSHGRFLSWLVGGVAWQERTARSNVPCLSWRIRRRRFRHGLDRGVSAKIRIEILWRSSPIGSRSCEC